MTCNINIIKENESELDLICFDEAHHIVSHNIKKLLFNYDEDKLKVKV